MADKVNSLNEVINAEKETRDMWIERFEKEVKDHSRTQNDLLTAKSELKDS